MKNRLLSESYRFVPFFALLILADFFFWKNPAMNVGAAIFMLLSAAIVLPRNWNKFSDKKLLISLFIALLLIDFSLLFQNNFGNIALSLLLTMLFSYSVENGVPRQISRYFKLLCGFVYGFFKDFCIFWQDNSEEKTAKSQRIKTIYKQIVLWIIPIIITSIFVIVFSNTNPIFAEKFRGIIDYIKKLDIFNLPHIIFLIAFAMWITFIISMRSCSLLLNSQANNTTQIDYFPKELTTYNEKAHEFIIATMMRALILFNIVFLIYNITDIDYIWRNSFTSTAQLPEGISSYANYAHRGAYPLIGVAIFSGIIVMITFYKELKNRTYAIAKILVYIWLAQNIFLVISACLRLRSYVQYYHLTTLRLAAFIWMGLVIFGIATLIHKIVLEKNNRFVIKNCFIVLLAVIIGCSFWNVKNFVAYYSSPKEKKALANNTQIVALDTKYLLNLETPALQAIELAAQSDLLNQNEIKRYLELKNKQNKKLANWRSWNLQDYLVSKKLKNYDLQPKTN